VTFSSKLSSAPQADRNLPVWHRTHRSGLQSAVQGQQQRAASWTTHIRTRMCTHAHTTHVHKHVYTCTWYTPTITLRHTWHKAAVRIHIAVSTRSLAYIHTSHVTTCACLQCIDTTALISEPARAQVHNYITCHP